MRQAKFQSVYAAILEPAPKAGIFQELSHDSLAARLHTDDGWRSRCAQPRRSSSVQLWEAACSHRARAGRRLPLASSPPSAAGYRASIVARHARFSVFRSRRRPSGPCGGSRRALLRPGRRRRCGQSPRPRAVLRSTPQERMQHGQRGLSEAEHLDARSAPDSPAPVIVGFMAVHSSQACETQRRTTGRGWPSGPELHSRRGQLSHRTIRIPRTRRPHRRGSRLPSSGNTDSSKSKRRARWVREQQRGVSAGNPHNVTLPANRRRPQT